MNLMFWRKRKDCEHPFHYLVMDKKETHDSTDDDGLFTNHTTHLFCLNCKQKLQIHFAEPTAKFKERKKEIINDCDKN